MSKPISKETNLPFRFESWELSGFGDSYEQGCQTMLAIGLVWLRDKDKDVLKGTHGLKNIYGIAWTPASAKELEVLWDTNLFLEKNGMTGAMHQCVVNHLQYIHEHGFDSWSKMMRKARKPDEEYKVELTDMRGAAKIHKKIMEVA